MAHNEVYGTEIKKGVIMMCSVDCFYQEFVLEGREFERAAEAWNTRLEKFIQSIQPPSLEQSQPETETEEEGS
jgi:hypothetical protein